MAKLNMGKSRPADKPYLITTDPRLPGWEWRVVKAYTSDPDSRYARWLCVVSSPNTFGGADMGDTYVSEVGPVIMFRDPVVADEDLPTRMRGQ